MYNIHIAQAEVPMEKIDFGKKIMFKKSNWPAIAYNIQTYLYI